MCVNRISSNEIRTIPFVLERDTMLKDDWPMHEQCNDWYGFIGFLKDKQSPNHEFFFRYRYERTKDLRDMQQITIQITDLLTGSYYSYKQDEFASIDELGKIRTNSSIISPDFDQKSIQLYAGSDNFVVRMRLSYDKISIQKTKAMKNIVGKKESEYTNMQYSLHRLPAEGKLFLNNQDHIIAYTGEIFLEREFGPSERRSESIVQEWLSIDPIGFDSRI